MSSRSPPSPVGQGSPPRQAEPTGSERRVPRRPPFRRDLRRRSVGHAPAGLRAPPAPGSTARRVHVLLGGRARGLGRLRPALRRLRRELRRRACSRAVLAASSALCASRSALRAAARAFGLLRPLLGFATCLRVRPVSGRLLPRPRPAPPSAPRGPLPSLREPPPAPPPAPRGRRLERLALGVVADAEQARSRRTPGRRSALTPPGSSRSRPTPPGRRCLRVNASKYVFHSCTGSCSRRRHRVSSRFSFACSRVCSPPRRSRRLIAPARGRASGPGGREGPPRTRSRPLHIDSLRRAVSGL